MAVGARALPHIVAPRRVKVAGRPVLACHAVGEGALADVDVRLEPVRARVQHLVDDALHCGKEAVPRIVAHCEQHVDDSPGARGGASRCRCRCRQWRKRVARALQQVVRGAGGARRERRDSTALVGKQWRAGAGALRLGLH